jgi:hypothetical protein
VAVAVVLTLVLVAQVAVELLEIGQAHPIMEHLELLTQAVVVVQQTVLQAL